VRRRAGGAGGAVRCIAAVPRRLATLAAAVSLLLCVATVALWIGTLGREVSLYRGQVKQQTLRGDWFALGRGEFIWSSSIMPAGRPHAKTGYTWRAEDRWDNARLFLAYGSGLRRVGFEMKSGTQGRERYRLLAAPCWFVALALSILPAMKGLSLYRRRKLVAEHGCPRCGYDLRATPERCPECGAVPAAPAAR
jgi:hypothetical protein